MAVDAPLSGETAVGFDDFVTRNPDTPFQGVDILREAHMQQGVGSQKADERMSDRRPEFAWI